MIWGPSRPMRISISKPDKQTNTKIVGGTREAMPKVPLTYTHTVSLYTGARTHEHAHTYHTHTHSQKKCDILCHSLHPCFLLGHLWLLLKVPQGPFVPRVPLMPLAPQEPQHRDRLLVLLKLSFSPQLSSECEKVMVTLTEELQSAKTVMAVRTTRVSRGWREGTRSTLSI